MLASSTVTRPSSKGTASARRNQPGALADGSSGWLSSSDIGTTLGDGRAVTGLTGRVPSITFLGTGNYLAPGRYWNSFVLDGIVLVEPSPTALPHLRHCGIRAGNLEAVVISHFHPDHTFGWPFLLLELLHS